MSRQIAIAGRILLIIVLLALIGFSAYRLAVQPWQKRQAQIAELQNSVTATRAKLVSIETAKHDVAVAAKCSIGTTAPLARMQYQRWLLNVTQQLGIEDAIVIPVAARPTDYGHLLPFRIEVCASQNNIGALIQTIHDSKALHRITALILTPHKSGLHKVEVGLEALHVDGEDLQRATLLSEEIDAVALTSRLLFTDRDLFARPESKPNLVPVSQSVSRPLPTSLQLVATFFRDGQRYAWLLDPRTDQEYSAPEQGTLVVDSRTLHVGEIGKDFVTLKHNGSVRRVNLGDETRLENVE